MLNPPGLWITINPSDLHDPIAQFLVSEQIDLDCFLDTKDQDPTHVQHAQNIAADPYAVAKFFHFLIHTILETLIGVQATDFQVFNKVGIFGHALTSMFSLSSACMPQDLILTMLMC